MKSFNVGDKAFVAKAGEATFDINRLGHFIPGKSRSLSNEGHSGWINDVTPPWFPHNEVVEIYQKLDDSHYIVKTIDGKIWPNKIGFWALIRVSDDK